MSEVKGRGTYMNVSRDRLSVIGKLIGIYREERRSNSQNGFTLKKFCEGICSINTLKRIEAGGLSRSEDVYIELLGKLDLKFGEFPVIDEALSSILSKIAISIEYYDLKLIGELCEKALEILKVAKHYIYYGEIYEIVSDIYNYYKYDLLMDTNRVTICLSILKNHVFEYEDILKIILFAKIKTESVIDENSYLKVIKELELNNARLSCIKINILHYYLVIGDYLLMQSLINELEIIFREENNIIRLIDIYNYAIVMYSYIGKRNLNSLLNKIDDLVNKNDIPNIKLCEIYSNIGSFYHNDRQYAKALKYYNKMLGYYDENYLPHLIYVADCQNHLNLEINIPIIDNAKYTKYPIELRLMYKYFVNVIKSPDFVRQNYIVRKILPNLQNETNIKIFRYELNKIVERTGHYKSLYLFDKQISIIES